MDQGQQAHVPARAGEASGVEARGRAKIHHIPLDDVVDRYKGDQEDMTRLGDQPGWLLVADYAAVRSPYGLVTQERKWVA